MMTTEQPALSKMIVNTYIRLFTKKQDVCRIYPIYADWKVAEGKR